ncbi:MAG TPA: mannose-1-phosphate guanylyltransferase [Pirellulales bacterium]|nr:mannose-1-phosphate guanylyltransferase [Pirellulales bacterium]
MLHAIVMAGGSGTRFWPESRDLRPKQLLRFAGERSMIQSTIDRLKGLVPPERMLIATNARLAQVIGEQLPELPPEAILGEPCKRDTAPCIGLAALLVSQRDPEATMAVMPSDHVINPDSAFCQAIEFAAALVDESPARIVTFGIRPTYPAEIFGYIERGEKLETAAAKKRSSFAPAFQVRQFREKPKADVARAYVDSGRFFWNAGIFVWRAATILQALRQHQPEMFGHLQRIAQAFGQPGYQQVLEREFAAIRGVSIDYAVMEHARDVAVIEAPYDWDDVGSWQALARLHGTDENGNTIIGKHMGLNTSGTILRGSNDHLIVTLGVKDCVIVHTPDATLVANKHDEESIRQVVKLLQEKGWTEYL